MISAHPIYPVNAFPPTIANAILELHSNVQAPMPLVATTVLIALTAAVQCRVKVKLPFSARPKPVSVYVIIVGETGDRKSALESYVMEPIHKRDERLELASKEQEKLFESKLKVWSFVNEELIRRVAKASLDNLPADDLHEQLKHHVELKPQKPSRTRILHQDTSPRAVLDALEGRTKSIVIHSDEGESILRGPLLKTSGVLNKAWDGGPIILDRANGVSFSARDTRLTFSILVQPGIFRSFLDKDGDRLRDSGLFARCLITKPQSYKGYRFTTTTELSWKHLPKLHEQISAELQLIPDSNLVAEDEQIVYELDDEAKDFLKNLTNSTEMQLQPTGYCHDISDFASKASEIAVRVSAVLHHFGEQSGKISRDTLMRAADIVGFHLNEYKRIMAEPGAHLSAHEDAQKLWNYLYSKHFVCNNISVPRNLLLQYGPFRKNARLQCAIDMLTHSRQIWIGKDGRGRTYVNAMPVALPTPSF